MERAKLITKSEFIAETTWAGFLGAWKFWSVLTSQFPGTIPPEVIEWARKYLTAFAMICIADLKTHCCYHASWNAQELEALTDLGLADRP